MELWDVYDKNRQKSNRTIVRGQSMQEDEYHMVVHVCLFNKTGDMLIQQRQPFKEGWPNLWDITVGGSALAGETSQQAAARELYEEIGLQMDFEQLRPHLTIHFERGLDDIYLIEQEISLQTLTLQSEEVQQVKWAGKEVILSMIQQHLFIPYYEGLIHLLFDSRKQRGALKI